MFWAALPHQPGTPGDSAAAPRRACPTTPTPSVVTSNSDRELAVCTRKVPSSTGTATFDKPYPPSSGGHLRTQRTNHQITTVKAPAATPRPARRTEQATSWHLAGGLSADPAGHASLGAWAVAAWSGWSRVAAQLARRCRPSWEAEPGSAPYTTSDSPGSAGRFTTS